MAITSFAINAASYGNRCVASSGRGFRHVSIFHSPEELIGLAIRREPLWNNKKNEAGPFDIIGDIHGCLDETLELLASLGYTVGNEAGRYSVSHPHGRKIVFAGDLVDRGPNSPGVIRLVMDAVASGAAFCVAGDVESAT
ncbi:MAG TPA: metallophosphoesterase [Steroidobacteraceae bacterium]